MAPNPTVSGIELVDRVIPLLKTAKGLLEGVELGLAETTVASSQVVPHLMSSGLFWQSECVSPG